LLRGIYPSGNSIPDFPICFLSRLLFASTPHGRIIFIRSVFIDPSAVFEHIELSQEIVQLVHNSPVISEGVQTL
jgi:hypothetical protein